MQITAKALPLNISRIFDFKLPKINWARIAVIGFCLVVLLSVCRIYQYNVALRDDYMARSYQKVLNNLISENKDLEIKLAQISYLDNVKESAVNLDFENVQTIKYIQVLDGSLAKK